MSNYKRPGVFVTESLLSSQAVGAASAASVGAFMEVSYRGPTTEPHLVSSWAEFVQLYGGFSGIAAKFRFLPYAVYQYFVNGGAACWIQRVVGTGAAAATASLNDVAATPHATLTASAKNPGIWGNSTYVQIVDRDAVNGRFDLFVNFGGTTDSAIVERFTNVTMDKTDDRYVVGVVNSTTAGSNYVTLTDASSPTAAPSNKPAVGTFVMSAGLDGADPASSDYLNTALPLLEQVPDPIVLNIPGCSSSTIINGVHAFWVTAGRTNGFLITDTASGLDPNGAVTYEGLLTATSHGAVYYPWQHYIDAASTLPGATILLPPGGSIMGLYMQTDRARGPFKTPAGFGTTIAGVVNNERQLSNSDLDTLNSSNVNAIRQVPGVGIVAMGGLTLQKTGSTSFIAIRRSLIYIEQSLQNLSLFAVFEPNDARLWSLISDVFGGFLNGYWNQGGLAGDTPNDAFFVTCDDTNNTQQTIGAGEVHADVGVSLEFPAQFVVINIAQWQGGSSAVTV